VSDLSAAAPRVFDEADFRRLLAWEVQRATRYQDFLSICLARPDHPGAPSRDVLEALAHRAAELLRATDVVGLQGDDRIAILLVHTPDSDAIGITDRVRGLLESLTLRPESGAAPVKAVLRLGLASFPTDATSDGALLERAEARLAAARHGAEGPQPIS
jgi:PleD family two-component response regulator